MTKLAVGVLALLAIYLLFTYVFPILGDVAGGFPKYFMPFVLALFFALLIEPAIRFMERRLKMGRGLATIMSMLLVLGSLGLILTFLITKLINELISIYRLISVNSGDLIARILDGFQQIQLLYGQLNLPVDLEKSMQTSLAQIISGAEELLNLIVNSLITIMANVPGYFIFLMIAVVATYFMAHERPEIKAWFLRSLPPTWEGKTQTVASDLISALLGFIKAQFILVSITGLQTIIGLKIIGAEYALTIGLLVGLLDILPILGPGLVFIPWGLFAVFSGQVGFGIALLILYAVLVIVRYIIEPRIIGNNIGLHPLATLISLYVGLKAAGVIGMFLGPILVIVVLACFRAGVFDRWLWNRTD
ncbi:MAG: sporulation integral membrane protein YtvI [Syntrophomonadaceae bacterium]|nr:sporulation integral membrane protein YtvI [Syntrophomonadaceae bacterium]